jgi:hypothetical protein
VDSVTGEGNSPSGPYQTIDISTGGSAVNDGTNGTPRTGAETRPANVSVQYCVKY